MGMAKRAAGLKAAGAIPKALADFFAPARPEARRSPTPPPPKPAPPTPPVAAAAAPIQRHLF